MRLVEKPLIPPETTLNQKGRTIQKIDSEDQLQSQTRAYSISFESDFQFYYFGPFPLWTTDLTWKLYRKVIYKNYQNYLDSFFCENNAYMQNTTILNNKVLV